MTLTRIVSWSHTLVREVLRPGDLAADLTAGKGRDTMVLAEAIGSEGRVVAFDIQAKALEQTAERLRLAGYRTTFWREDRMIPTLPGCYLVHTCHCDLDKFTGPDLRAVVMNLGYLPGEGRQIKTAPETTVEALRQGLELLVKGGRLAVTVYPGHPGGAEEGRAVTNLLGGLSSQAWQVLHLLVANQPQAPYLLVAEKTV